MEAFDAAKQSGGVEAGLRHGPGGGAVGSDFTATLLLWCQPCPAARSAGDGLRQHPREFGFIVRGSQQTQRYEDISAWQDDRFGRVHRNDFENETWRKPGSELRDVTLYFGYLHRRRSAPYFNDHLPAERGFFLAQRSLGRRYEWHQRKQNTPHRW